MCLKRRCEAPAGKPAGAFCVAPDSAFYVGQTGAHPAPGRLFREKELSKEGENIRRCEACFDKMRAAVWL